MAVTPSLQVVGYVNEISRNLVSGWAWDHTHPETSIEVEILVDGKSRARLLTKSHLPNLVERLRLPTESEAFRSSITGNYGFEFKFEPPLSVYRDYSVEVRALPSGAMVPPGAKRLRRVSVEPLATQPILVTSAGRSGSTLLMATLAAHPKIVVAEVYPMEVKLLAYYAVAFKTLVANADRENSMGPDDLFTERCRHSIGFNPYNRPGLHRQIVKNVDSLENVFNDFIPDTLRKAFRDIISKYYDTIRTDQGKTAATYFAEKADAQEDARFAPRVFYGHVREILLVRDPRDLICSSKAFWKIDATHAMESTAHAMRRLLEIDQESRSDVLVMKYEDFVGEPTTSRARLWRFLGLDEPRSETTASFDALFKSHGTSADPRSSVGRFSSDLTREERIACEKKCRDYMRHFGYLA